MGQLSVALGGHDLSKMEENKQIYDIDKLFYHPDSGQKNRFNYDLAILKISLRSGDSKDENMDHFYKPICLPKSSLLLREGTTMVAAGWGLTYSGGTL